MEVLISRDGECPIAELLEVAGSGRETLRRLVRRGAIRLEKRTGRPGLVYEGFRRQPYRLRSRGGTRPFAGRSLGMADAGGAEHRGFGCRQCGPPSRRGEQALVLAPEIESVERLVGAFEELLPAGLTVAPYHSTLGRRRAAVYVACSGERWMFW